MEGVVAVAALAQQDFLAPLSNHAQGGLEHTVNWPQRRGGAGQVQPWKRLGNPICVHGSLDSLNEFLAIGLYPLDLTFSRLLEHSIQRSLFSGCSIARPGRCAESVNHWRGSFYHPLLQNVYNSLRQKTCFAAHAAQAGLFFKKRAMWKNVPICHAKTGGKIHEEAYTW